MMEDCKMTDILGYFSTDASIGRSILTADEPEELTENYNKPISVFSIAQKYSLKNLFIVDSSMSNFIKLYKTAEKHKIQLHFGIKLTCCADINDKSDESRKTEHKIIIWLKNSAGYSSFCKIYSASWLKGQYYVNRIDLKTLNEFWDDRYFSLFCDPYGGFISRNLLEDYICNPDFGAIKPILTYTDTVNLPFCYLIKDAVLQYGKNNDLDVVRVHPIYYHAKKDAKAYQIFRAIQNRSKFSKPQLNHFSSPDFSWETYQEAMKL